MNEILKIFDITKDELNNLTEEKKQELEKKLKEDKYIDLFAKYISNNFDNESDDVLNSILSFLTTLSTLRNDNSWQIAIRHFCNYVNCRILLSAYFNKEALSHNNYFETITNLCMQIIYKEIPNNLSEEEKSLLTNIILSEFLSITNTENSNNNLAIERLIELGMSKKEILKLNKAKLKLLEPKKESSKRKK